MLNDAKYSVEQLIEELLVVAPKRYRVLMCTDYCLTGSPWTDEFHIEVDDKNKVVRIRAREMT